MGCCLGFTLSSVWWRLSGARFSSLPKSLRTAIAAAILLPPYLVGALLWVWLLRAVGSKYNIVQVRRTPWAFLLKTCCCLCAMNIRVGLHVDRAQGYAKPQNAVQFMVRVAENMGVMRRSCNHNGEHLPAELLGRANN